MDSDTRTAHTAASSGRALYQHNRHTISWLLFRLLAPIMEQNIDVSLHRDKIILLPRHDTRTVLPPSPFAGAPNSHHGPHASSSTAPGSTTRSHEPCPFYGRISAAGCDPFRPGINRTAQVLGSGDGDGLPHSSLSQAATFPSGAISSKNGADPAQHGDIPFRPSDTGSGFTRRKRLNRHSRIRK